MNIEIYEWTQKGGKYFGGANIGGLFMVNWAYFLLGFEVMPSGICLFIGPFCFGVARPKQLSVKGEQD